ncbi:MAG: two pore domain potassium channel family protein [Lachnospiraceae bacterium]|nr:two pore domain potassium channel family protein [Lachnospiraceae bacterium]
MPNLRTLYRIMKQTSGIQIFTYYMVFVFLSALLILLVEPEITNYTDALWYCYAVISTAGFGDIVVHTILAKLISVVVTVYSLVVIAILTGIVVNFYNEILEARRKETLSAFLDRLEKLPELSHEELVELSKRVHQFRLKKK